MSRRTISEEPVGGAELTGPPKRDPEAVASVGKRASLVSLDLVGGQFFTHDDDSELPPPPTSFKTSEPEFGLHASWALAEDGSRLGCLLTFSSFFPENASPYEVTGRFRVVYSLSPGPRLEESAVEQFVYWNAFFNVWPYWREYFSAFLMRSWVPKFTPPVLFFPGGGAV
jgi:hypothetical protein